MKPVTNQFDEILVNRHSIRKYKSYDIDDDTIRAIFEMALKAPSAKNFQPWTFRIIKTKTAKDKYSHLFVGNRTQYETASVMVILFTDTRYGSRAQDVYDKAVLKNLMTPENREKQLLNLKNLHPSAEDVLKQGILNVGLITMNLMLVARHYGFDTCPIAGFEKALAPAAFGLDHHEAVLAISMGIADDLGKPSVRLDFDEVAKIE